jgi:hypothetical protein
MNDNGVVELRSGPSLLIRAVWYLLVGWWLAGLAMGLAWLGLARGSTDTDHMLRSPTDSRWHRHICWGSPRWRWLAKMDRFSRLPGRALAWTR